MTSAVNGTHPYWQAQSTPPVKHDAPPKPKKTENTPPEQTHEPPKKTHRVDVKA